METEKDVKREEGSAEEQPSSSNAEPCAEASKQPAPPESPAPITEESAADGPPAPSTEERPQGGSAKGLKLACGLTALACAIVAALTVIMLYFVVLPNGDSLTVTLSTALLGLLYAVVMASVSLSCVLSGILMLTNRKNGGSVFTVVNILGLFDFVAMLGTVLISSLTGKLSASWFVVFAVPFAADFALRVLCSIFCKQLKEND